MSLAPLQPRRMCSACFSESNGDDEYWAAARHRTSGARALSMGPSSATAAPRQVQNLIDKPQCDHFPLIEASRPIGYQRMAQQATNYLSTYEQTTS